MEESKRMMLPSRDYIRNDGYFLFSYIEHFHEFHTCFDMRNDELMGFFEEISREDIIFFLPENPDHFSRVEEIDTIENMCERRDMYIEWLQSRKRNNPIWSMLVMGYFFLPKE
jgi:hypothetical protein